MQQHCSTMRWLVHFSLLAVCAVADATYVNYLPVQTVMQPVAAYPTQGYSYLPPVQRYIYLNGQPYAVLGEQIQYLPAASAAPYASPPQPGAAPSADNLEPVSINENTNSGQVAPAANPSAYASTNPVGNSLTHEATAHVAPAPASGLPASPAESSAAASSPPEPVPKRPIAAPAASPTEPAPGRTIAAPSEPAPERTFAAPAAASSEPVPDRTIAAPAAAPSEPTPQRTIATPAAAPSEPAPERIEAPGPLPIPATLSPSEESPALDGRGLDPAPAVLPGTSQVVEEPSAAVPIATRGMEAAPAPGAQPTQSAAVYLSAASGPSVPLAQQFLVLSVNNPKVTVRRKESVYSWHHPGQTVNAPIKMVFFSDPQRPPSTHAGIKLAPTNGLAATINSQPNEISGSIVDPAKLTVYSQPQPSAPQPASAALYSQPQPLSPQSATVAQYSRPEPPPPQSATAELYSQPQPFAPKPVSAADLIRYTLSQSPLLRIQVDPATLTSFYLDSEGRRINLPASAPAAAPVPLQLTPTNYVNTENTLYSATGSPSDSAAGYTHSTPQYYGSAKDLPAPVVSSASENYKAYDMTGLGHMERMYAPSTFNGPAPQSPSYDKPLTLSISTGKEAERGASGPPSPLSPGDMGPSRGDSVENPARPKLLWSDARVR